MALTPQNEDAFLREVDEELRREQLGTFWRRYGRLLIGLVVAGLLAFGGYLWWQAEQEKAAGAAGEKLTQALEAVDQGRTAEGEAALKALAQGGTPGYAAAAKFALAARKLQAGDVAGAVRDYDALAADQELAEPFRNLATIRATAAAFDTLKPEAVIERLKPLAVQGGPWFGSAGEMTAAAWLKLSRPDKAGAIFGAIARDKSVPQSIRGRAIRIAGALGVDAVPTADQAQAEKE